ncbi:pyridoxal phosphate-dependent aminotransferase [Pseudidiomarina sp. GXY010]|uniref:alanine transaminase n=1 Tax=Pseudidiomarina fusca TaxID=2965078 RepID=A0ABU3KZQ2_9GAMM|nr:pyridoxal phosphate-dependent aminotransferase [Pseudidiomarina sp. GXY010]MDT7526366.1 pyridoxal phosphate-dependent aminotransferase [Pseudidiomarina sp. GXY010]
MVTPATRMQNIRYDIRGAVQQEAERLEKAGHPIIRLNIGNLAPYELYAPQEIVSDIAENLFHAQGYSHSKGLFQARKAVMQEAQRKGIEGVTHEHIFMGNGVSELISLVTQAIVNPDDEVLIPSPDYPLWSAAVTLAGGKPVYYQCEPANQWAPNVKDIASKVTAKTRAILVINPNNPTGAVYSKALLTAIADIAEAHQLLLFSDEIYDKVLFDETEHVSIAALNPRVLCFTFNGLSKAYRAAGFRSGWLIISGAIDQAGDIFNALETLSSMRLCANVPAQLAVQTALGGSQSIEALCAPEGRLYEQRNFAVEHLNAIPGVSVNSPQGAMYLFVHLDPELYPIENDQDFAMQLLQQEKVLVVPGSGFNLASNQYFRMVFLPKIDDLHEAISRIARFLKERLAAPAT